MKGEMKKTQPNTGQNYKKNSHDTKSHHQGGSIYRNRATGY